MKRTIATVSAVAGMALSGSPASAQMSVDTARASLAPFYRALNAAYVDEAPELIKQSTAPDWVTCRGNDLCNSREEVIAGIAPRLKAIPDLKWEIKELLVSGDRAIVRGEATGTPAGPFMGVPRGGKSFRIMSIDVHTIKDGKLVRAYHVEDWMGAVRQLSSQ